MENREVIVPYQFLVLDEQIKENKLWSVFF